MTQSGRRLARCLWEYTVFVLLLLMSVVGVLGMFFLLSGHPPSYLTAPVSGNATEVRTVILDAGHGGEDGGAVGTLNGREIREKDLNLAIACLLRDLLEADGVNIMMTREEDVLLYDRNTDYEGRKKVLDLAARLAIGQSTPNAMFVSIHMNAFPQAKYHGLQVYYSPNHTLSEDLAQGIQSRVCTGLQPDNHRSIKRAGSEIHLLEHLNCPAVLVECGFLSNAEECAALTDADYQQRLAFLLFCAICECLEQEDKTVTSGDGIALSAFPADFIAQMTEIAAEDLIFDKKYYIMGYQKSKTEVTRHESNQNHLYLLGMRDEKPQMVGQMPLVRCVELVC